MPYHTHIIQQVLGLEDALRAAGSAIQGQWLWNDSTAGGDPGKSYMAGNNANMDSITVFYINKTTLGGAQIPPNSIYQPGDLIYIVDEDRAAYGRYEIVTTATDTEFTTFNVIPLVGSGNPQQDNVMDAVYLPQSTAAFNAADIAWVKSRGVP